MKVVITLIVFSIGLLCALVLGEGILRLAGIYPVGKRFQAGNKRVFTPDPEILPGTSSPVYYTRIKGLRGPQPKSSQSYRILVVGGSTTECFFLDDTLTWPAQLQFKLNLRCSTDSFWVGNAGYSGAATIDHLRDFRRFYKSTKGVDAVIFLVGMNDFSRSIMGIKNLDRKKRYGHIKALWYKIKYLLWKTSSIYALIQAIELDTSTESLRVSLSKGSQYILYRSNRQNAKMYLKELPNSFHKDLIIFEKNVEELIQLCKRRSLRTIFLTQPTAWHPDMKEHMKKLLWCGFTQDSSEKNQAYYSIDVMVRGISLFNESLKIVCSENSVELYDLAKISEADTTMFYDDCHFNNNGAHKVAEYIAAHFLLENYE